MAPLTTFSARNGINENWFEAYVGFAAVERDHKNSKQNEDFSIDLTLWTSAVIQEFGAVPFRRGGKHACQQPQSFRSSKHKKSSLTLF